MSSLHRIVTRQHGKCPNQTKLTLTMRNASWGSFSYGGFEYVWGEALCCLDMEARPRTVKRLKKNRWHVKLLWNSISQQFYFIRKMTSSSNFNDRQDIYTWSICIYFVFYLRLLPASKMHYLLFCSKVNFIFFYCLNYVNFSLKFESNKTKMSF